MTDAGPEVAEAHRALTVVVSPDQLVDYPPSPLPETEGVGHVVAVGAGVKHVKEGDRTLVPCLHPTWAERIKTDAPWWRPLPPGDINQFAMMGVNPGISQPSRITSRRCSIVWRR